MFVNSPELFMDVGLSTFCCVFCEDQCYVELVNYYSTFVE